MHYALCAMLGCLNMQISLPRASRKVCCKIWRTATSFVFPRARKELETIKMGAIVKVSRPFPAGALLQVQQQQQQQLLTIWLATRWHRTYIAHLHNKTYLNIIIIRHRVAQSAAQAGAAPAACPHGHQAAVGAFVDHKNLQHEAKVENKVDSQWVKALLKFEANF